MYVFLKIPTKKIAKLNELEAWAEKNPYRAPHDSLTSLDMPAGVDIALKL